MICFGQPILGDPLDPQIWVPTLRLPNKAITTVPPL